MDARNCTLCITIEQVCPNSSKALRKKVRNQARVSRGSVEREIKKKKKELKGGKREIIFKVANCH